MSGPSIEPLVAACPADQGIPLITKFSQLGAAPEYRSEGIALLLRRYWWKPFGGLFAIVATAATVALLTAIMPLLVLASLIQYLWSLYACRAYHTPPSSIKIAIIGGG